MRTLTILKDKPDSKKRTAICKAAIDAAAQDVEIITQKGKVHILCLWEVRQK